MSPDAEHYLRRVMSGAERSPRAAALRAAMAAAAVPYASVVRLRNGLFDAGLRRPHRLPRPVISVGNITTGGTGKTPVVRWLVERLRTAGKSVAILSRGYKAKPGEPGDEQRMLADLLNGPGAPDVAIRANPNRVAAGRDVFQERPGTDVFVLDDGFQHRRLARDFDLVLINAAEPFGFGRVLPRGMLREPLGGLRRANAFLLTRCNLASDAARAEIRATLRLHNPAAPVFESVHAPTALRTGDPAAPPLTLDAIRDRRWFAFCGLGDPSSFVRQLESLGGNRAGERAFPDHHAYTNTDVHDLRKQAAAAGANALITTEKDWVKLAALSAVAESAGIPIWRLDVEIRFSGDHETRLLGEIDRVVAASAPWL